MGVAKGLDSSELIFITDGIGAEMPAILMTPVIDAVLVEPMSAFGARHEPLKRLLFGSFAQFSLASRAATDPVARAFDPSLSAMTKPPV